MAYRNSNSNVKFMAFKVQIYAMFLNPDQFEVRPENRLYSQIGFNN